MTAGERPSSEHSLQESPSHTETADDSTTQPPPLETDSTTTAAAEESGAAAPEPAAEVCKEKLSASVKIFTK